MFDGFVEALCQRFEPDSRRELYAAEFQMRRKRKTESWADFGDDICALAAKAFPNLGAGGRQQLTLHQYLANQSNRQASDENYSRGTCLYNTCYNTTLI